MFNFKKLIFVFRLFKVILDYAVCIDKLTDFCIAINPKQQYLYKFLGFTQVGPLKYYGFVNRAPAIAFRLKLSDLEEKVRARKGLYKIFLAEKTKPDLFEGKFKLGASDLEYFFVKKSDIFEKAKREQIEYVKSCYPNLNFNKLMHGK